MTRFRKPPITPQNFSSVLVLTPLLTPLITLLTPLITPLITLPTFTETTLLRGVLGAGSGGGYIPLSKRNGSWHWGLCI